MPDPIGARWRKSTRSNNAGNCVEVADNLPAVIGLRDSKDPEGPALTFSRSDWARFLKRVKDGSIAG
jgi:hypothetical protein